MSLLVTGSIGIDSVTTPHGSADCAAGLNCGSAYVFRVPEAADFDRDGDVDLFDFASLQAQFTGDLFDFVSLHAQFTGPQ